MEQFTHATVVEWISCLPLVNTTSTSTWLGSKHKQQATTGVKYECSMHFTRVQAPPPVVKVRTLNAFYQEHIIHLLLFWQLQNCDDSVKVAWKGGNPSCIKLPYYGFFCPKGITNQLKWLCIWQFSNCGPVGWVEIHMTFHHIYTIHTIGQRQNECTKVFGKCKSIIQDLWTHLCNMKQLALFPGYPLTPTTNKNGASFPGPPPLFLGRAWERGYEAMATAKMGLLHCIIHNPRFMNTLEQYEEMATAKTGLLHRNTSCSIQQQHVPPLLASCPSS